MAWGLGGIFAVLGVVGVVVVVGCVEGSEYGVGGAVEVDASGRANEVDVPATAAALEWDENGYLLFCLCHGRFGNQADQLLGALAFAKKLNRTLVVPPFVTYPGQFAVDFLKFSEVFRLDKLGEYHRVVEMDDFMEQLAPDFYPASNRALFCMPSRDTGECHVTQGNPFGPFWSRYGIEFAEHISIDGLSFTPESREVVRLWKVRFPPHTYPVIATYGPPARYPVSWRLRQLQRHIQWNERSAAFHAAQAFREQHFAGGYVAVHLRVGMDWESVCGVGPRASNYPAVGKDRYMSSPQCIRQAGQTISMDMCLPGPDVVASAVRNALEDVGASKVLIGIDHTPKLESYRQAIEVASPGVEVHHFDENSPRVDLMLFAEADHFIGSCVSSFTAFAVREREVHGRASSFFGQYDNV